MLNYFKYKYMVKYKLFFGDSNIRMFQHLPEINQKYKMLSVDEYNYDSMAIYKYNYTNGEDVLISVFSFVGASAVGLSKEKNSKLQAYLDVGIISGEADGTYCGRTHDRNYAPPITLLKMANYE